MVDGATIRKVLLETVADLATKMPGKLTSVGILGAATSHLIKAGCDIRGDEDAERALLTLFYDMFRTGHLSWGRDLTNPDPPCCHLTEQGREALKHLSRDPANPDGYLEHLRTTVRLNPIAQSYIAEALHTYNASCLKAAAVMVGAAAEAVVVELRDALVRTIEDKGNKPRRKLASWKIAEVLKAISRELESRSSDMPRDLRDAFESLWPALTHQIRTVRNEAGHPKSIEPVTQPRVHSSLLLFPAAAKLAEDLGNWFRGV